MAEGSITVDTLQLGKPKHRKLMSLLLLSISVIKTERRTLKFWRGGVDSTVKHRKSVFLAIKWWSFRENHLLERHESEGSCLVCWYLRKSDPVAC